jgi:thioredoxin 1
MSFHSAPPGFVGGAIIVAETVCATLLSKQMLARRNSIIVAAIACALLLGCRQTPVDTEPTVEPGRAVIYPDGAQAAQDIAAALARAGKEKKRVLLDFGGNWCGDCQVLEIYFHDPANRPLLEKNYVLVPVNIGRYDQNLDIAARYGVPVDKGVPALAVLDANGQLVYSQRHAEFEAMQKINSAAVTQFLLQWKG